MVPQRYYGQDCQWFGDAAIDLEHAMPGTHARLDAGVYVPGLRMWVDIR